MVAVATSVVLAPWPVSVWAPAAAEASVDLVGVSLHANVAVSGPSFLEWTVRNQGTEPATGGWTDSIYISPAPICCSGATLLGGVSWPASSVVGPGATYSRQAYVQLPPLPLGDYYVIVKVNAPVRLAETTVANNDVAAPFRVAPNVQLNVFAVTAPPSAATRTPISVSWTVENASGVGLTEDATAELWQDNVYISPSSACCAGATFLGSFAHTGGLRAKQTLETGYGELLKIMEKEHVIFELPKLTDRADRMKAVLMVDPLVVPYARIPLLVQSLNEERQRLYLPPVPRKNMWENLR